jgi:hypothetical protein
MIGRISLLRALAPAAIGAFAFAGSAHAQNGSASQSFPGIAKVTVAVNGLNCSGSAVFDASAFEVAVTTLSGSGGGSSNKTVFGDLLVQRGTDACSLPLFILASHAAPIPQVVLNAADKSGKPVIAITLQNALLTSSQLNAAGASAAAQESLDFSYQSMTIRDSSGVSTTVVR